MNRRKPKVGGARPGAGRPSLGDDARSANVTVKLTPATRAAWRAAATREDSTLTDYVIAAVELALARGSTR